MSPVMDAGLAAVFEAPGTDRDALALVRAELRSWALLAAGSLAIAGIFAFLLALSRVPGSERLVHWPQEFFSKGLVIHVIFSLVVWFLSVFSLLATFAALEVADGRLRLVSLGRVGLALVAMSFPMLFLPALREDTVATLNNYIPVIIHPGYYAGLAVLAAGVLMPVLRLFANVHARHGRLGPFPSAMTSAGVVYCVAVVCFVAGLHGVWGESPSRAMHERLFWGGGHILQFLFCLLMLTGWHVLGRLCLNRDIADPDVFRLATGLIGVFALPALLFCLVFEPFSLEQTESFRRLQFVLAFPTMLVAAHGFATVTHHGRVKGLPWGDPAFVALALSPVVFGIGGLMGFLVTGTDTRTPAHYHGVIAGVNLAMMGLMLRYCLPGVERPVATSVRLRLQIVLFGVGQLMASIGLFLAGGYGAPRKTPSGSADLVYGAVAGMYLHGIGALLAIVGGVLFVATMLRALLFADSAAATDLWQGPGSHNDCGDGGVRIGEPR